MHDFAEWIPLLQTLLWAGLIAGVLIWGRQHWNGILRAVQWRVEHGDTVKLWAGSFSAELEREAQDSPRLTPKANSSPATEPDELEQERVRIGESQRGVHLVHIATPSAEPGQKYDLFVFLASWQRSSYGLPNDLSDVASAEFELGPKFQPSGTTVTHGSGGGPLGFATSAWGPVICVCRVTFSDGHQVVLSRYLDFEGAELTGRVLGKTDR